MMHVLAASQTSVVNGVAALTYSPPLPEVRRVVGIPIAKAVETMLCPAVPTLPD